MKIKRILCMAVTVLMSLCLTLSAEGCGSKKTGGSSAVTETYPDYIRPVYPAATDAKAGGNLYYAKDGESAYKIVIPANASEAVQYAAEFLTEITLDATGVTLSTVRDTDLSFDKDAYVISIGDTSVLSTSPIAATAKETLTDNGFVLSLQGNSVLIGGENDLGAIYGTQEFLAYTLSFDALTADALVYDHAKTVTVPDFGTVKQSPDIPRIAPGPAPAEGSERAALIRSYDRLAGWGSFTGPLWDTNLIAHSIVNAAPPAQYPDWYNNGQICYSATDSYDVIADYVANRIEYATTQIYFQLGNADTTTCCDCLDCTALANNNGGMGGAYVIWLNTIAEKVEQKLAAKGITDKEWHLLGLMYNAYDEAPVVWNEEQGKYVPVNENVICSPHVGVQYCPITACYGHVFDDPDCVENDKARIQEKLYGWAELTDEYIIWTYSTEFTNYFFIWDDYGSMAGDFRLFKELGVKGIYFNRGANGMNPFDAFRTYLIYKLCWNTQYDYDTLYNEFFHAYYREAAPYMQEYFEAIRANLNVIELRDNNDGCLLYGSKTSHAAYNWSYPLLLSYEKIVQKAYEALQNAGYSAEEYETMRLRVRADEMFITNYFVRFYNDYMSEEEYKKISDAYYADNLILGNEEQREHSAL